MALYRGSLHALLPLSSVSFPMCGCEHLWNLCDEWMRQERRQGNVSHCTTGVSRREKKENEQGTQGCVCVFVSMCVCVRAYVVREWGSVALELHTKAPTCTLPCIYVLTVRDAECAWTWIYVCARVAYVFADLWARARDCKAEIG